MTDEQIDAEVARIAALARRFLDDLAEHAEAEEHTDVQIQTWQVGAVVLYVDEDGTARERVDSGFETRSQTMQTGMVAAMASALG